MMAASEGGDGLFVESCVHGMRGGENYDQEP